MRGYATNLNNPTTFVQLIRRDNDRYWLHTRRHGSATFTLLSANPGRLSTLSPGRDIYLEYRDGALYQVKCQINFPIVASTKLYVSDRIN